MLTTYLAHWPGFTSLSLCCQAETVLHLRAQQLIGHHGVEPHWATNRRADCWLPHQPGEGDREDRPLQSWDRYICQKLSMSSVWVAMINKDQQVKKCSLWQAEVSKQPELPVLEAVKNRRNDSTQGKVIHICILDSLVMLYKWKTWWYTRGDQVKMQFL